ncbi:hypothetical protein GCM10023187_30170 [Nibrella viscosa]|uniref:Calcineurin-like phosphoesterase domain-containing protein n=1 Tax=Nibrella viscosa TaxID=1084524 RepID=A0ABP8KKP9_9BACT
MRIAFLTDLHIGAEGEKPQGVDVRQNFLNALAFLPEIKPDCIVLGGDLCYQTGERAVYQWIKTQLDPLPYPVYAIAGNHDDPVMMAEELELAHDVWGDELYFAFPLNGYPVVFLDTAKGYCSPGQMTWLQEHLHAIGRNILLFMHHPPVLAGVGHMDAHYAFQQRDEIKSIFNSLSGRITVACGHYHVEKTILQDNLSVLITPSLFFQMKHDPEKMVIDHYRIAIREINLSPDGVTSTVHYLMGERVKGVKERKTAKPLFRSFTHRAE